MATKAAKTEEVSDEYKQTIRKCPLVIRPGTGSEPRETVDVDWSYVLGQPGQEGMWHLLGWDPRLDPAAWVDESLQFAPAPPWARNETYIAALEAENALLKEKLRNQS